MIKMTPEIRATYETLNRTVDNFLSRSAYFVVSFPKIYQQYDIVDENENECPNNTKVAKKTMNWAQYF